MKFEVRKILREDWKDLGNGVPLCQFAYSVKCAENKLGIEFFQYHEDGLGEMYGLYILVGEFKYFLRGEPPKEDSKFGVIVYIRSIEINPKQMLKTICDLFGESQNALMWVLEDLSPPKWQLYRLDDNNNEIEVCRFLDETSAVCLKDKYERKGHKQAYFVRKLS